MSTLTVDTAARFGTNFNGGRGIIQVTGVGVGTTVTVQGSLDGTTYTNIEVFDEDKIKEILIPPYVKYSVSGGTPVVQIVEAMAFRTGR